MDSEAAFVTPASLWCRAPVISAEWNRKKVSRNRSGGPRPFRVGARQEGKLRSWKRARGERQRRTAPKPAWLLSESRLQRANPGPTRYSRAVAAGEGASLGRVAPPLIGEAMISAMAVSRMCAVGAE